MTQTRLKFKREKTRDYDQRNLESAKLILSDVERYGGEAAGVVIWARMATKRIETERLTRI